MARTWSAPSTNPVLVLADIALLDSLPERDFLAGYGEVVKYGLLGDAAFFDWLEAEGPAMAGGRPGGADMPCAVPVEMKAGIVARDETEQGERALLNLGHTFCHALEAATGYGERLLHGEGVAIGCALAFELSARLGLCAQETPGRVRAHLRAMGMRVDLSEIPGALPGPEALLALMGQDKKVAGSGAMRQFTPAFGPERQSGGVENARRIKRGFERAPHLPGRAMFGLHVFAPAQGDPMLATDSAAQAHRARGHAREIRA
jgi:3-dehydroquinate synthetase